MAFCYKDRAWCLAAPKCANAEGCWRHLDQRERESANQWALRANITDSEGNPTPPIAWMDFRNSCEDFKEK